jgi:hypothetical protein
VNALPALGDLRYQYPDDLWPPIESLRRLEDFGPYPFDDSRNLLCVSQHYESVFDRDRLVNLLRNEVQKGKEPSAALVR